VDELRRDLDSVVTKFARQYVGLAAVTLRDGELAMTGRGRTGPASTPPMPHTLFHTGPLTSVLTGLLLAELVCEGRTTLDTPVADFFRDVRVPDRGRPMTLEALATHTAGLPRLPRGRRGGASLSLGASELEDALGAARLAKAPWSNIRPSPFGSAVLGEALARLTGRPYSELIDARICGPLTMSDTVCLPSEEQRRRMARSHTRTGKMLPDQPLPVLPPLGALYSTPADVGEFLQAQLDPPDGTLGEAIAMTQVPRTARHRPLAMGLGWTRSRLRTGQDVLSHHGNNGGAAVFVGFVPEWRSAVGVLANSAQPVERLGRALLRAIGPPGPYDVPE
jgi:D-alanyl-D-alanine-carboxypeptidase/D-alanyl-D-alanine-endopeptidase